MTKPPTPQEAHNERAQASFHDHKPATSWTVRNIRTGATRTYQTRNAATRASIRIDAEYGSYISTIQPHWD